MFKRIKGIKGEKYKGLNTITLYQWAIINQARYLTYKNIPNPFSPE